MARIVAGVVLPDRIQDPVQLEHETGQLRIGTHRRWLFEDLHLDVRPIDMDPALDLAMLGGKVDEVSF